MQKLRKNKQMDNDALSIRNGISSLRSIFYVCLEFLDQLRSYIVVRVSVSRYLSFTNRFGARRPTLKCPMRCLPKTYILKLGYVKFCTDTSVSYCSAGSLCPAEAEVLRNSGVQRSALQYIMRCLPKTLHTQIMLVL